MIRHSYLFIASFIIGTLFSNPVFAQTKPVNWVYANGYAKNLYQTGILADEFFKKIKEQTHGRLNIRNVSGGALLTPENMIEGVRGDVANMGSTVVSFFPGQLPISATLASLVDLNYGNKLTIADISHLTTDLFNQVPEFSAEYEKLGLKAIWFVPSLPYAIISNKPIVTLHDFSGKKIRTLGSVLPKLLEAAGAVPLSVAFGEIYTSMQTGLLDGAMTDPPAMVNAHFEEVAKNLVTTGPGSGAFTAIAPVAYVVNLKDWNALAPDIRETVLKVAKDMVPIGAAGMATYADKAFNTLKAGGVAIHYLSQADTDTLAKKAPDFLKLAAANLNKNGLPGDKIIAKYRELADSYISKH